MLLGHQATLIAGKPVSLVSSSQIAGMLRGLGSEALAKKESALACGGAEMP
jgi:hypothetical protein